MDKVFNCVECQKSFKTKQILGKHTASFHSCEVLENQSTEVVDVPKVSKPRKVSAQKNSPPKEVKKRKSLRDDIADLKNEIMELKKL